jgi:mRNA interferase RelE/StbE
MASYKISLKKSVDKDLRKIDKSRLSQIISAIQKLSEDSTPPGSRKLVGSTRTYRIRVGDYRILYFVDNEQKAIEIQAVKHRKDAYR